MKTKIEWTDYTCNCFWGCENGCPYCAAKRFARRFGKSIGEKRGYAPDVIYHMGEFKPVFLWEQLYRIPKKPLKVFISMMGDWAADSFLDEDRDEVFEFIKTHPKHIFQLLTKQPQNLIKWSPFPDNCWVGVSATNTDMFIKAGFALEEIKAIVKFISAEPLLDWQHGETGFIATMLQKWGIKWLIIGQQTPVSVKTQPKIEWVREIVKAADKARIPVFLKDNLWKLLVPYIAGIPPIWARGRNRQDADILRQEFPK